MRQAQKKVMVLGAGTIGVVIACLLSEHEDYEITLADHDDKALDIWSRGQANFHTVYLNVTDSDALRLCLSEYALDGVISALPFYCNRVVARIANELQIAYFDLSEDVAVAQYIHSISHKQQIPFVPQCGLAPGFISIVANDLMGEFEVLETVKLRVGALPINPSNALKYSLTWSTEGLINEYCNPCHGIEEGQVVTLRPFEGYETIELDGLLYEAFNTSGGLGTLAETYKGRVQTMNYKTLRYPGHCEKMQFMMNDLKLKEDRKMLKKILENAIPKTLRDVVLIYVSVTGRQQGKLFEKNYANKIYPRKIVNKSCSAIQVTTAASVCAITDLVLQHRSRYQGFISQECFNLNEVLENRFGQFFGVQHQPPGLL
ncbi:MAG: saccharopine dehydrogenase C-terminal domain-containing protein [Methylococcales bacterium]|jgi:saccharopine dehydrogenase-like NADP-dependent oxidoreductase